MAWGALITADDGTQFITEESTPISLQGIYTGSGSGYVTLTIPIKTDDVVLPFCLATGNIVFSYSISGTTLTVMAYANSADTAQYTVTCYVFTTREQPLPKWGVAVWDKNGKCILTNETKVLTDIVTIGVKGSATSGLNLTSTRNGKWAILPELAGFYVGVYQQRPIQIAAGFTANYNGSTTAIKSVLVTQPPHDAQIGAPLDTKTVVRAIDVSRYD